MTSSVCLFPVLPVRKSEKNSFSPTALRVSIAFSKFAAHPVPQAKSSHCVVSKDFTQNQLKTEPEWTVKPTPNLPLHPVWDKWLLCSLTKGLREEREGERLTLWKKLLSSKSFHTDLNHDTHNEGGCTRKWGRTSKFLIHPSPPGDQEQVFSLLTDLLPLVTLLRDGCLLWSLQIGFSEAKEVFFWYGYCCSPNVGTASFILHCFPLDLYM